MTQKQKVLEILNDYHPRSLSCVQLCDIMIKSVDWESYDRYQLMASISSILSKMVKEEIIIYGNSTGPKRGYTYTVKKKIKLDSFKKADSNERIF